MGLPLTAVNPGGGYVETALYLISPYRNALNAMRAPGGVMLNSAGDQLSQEESVPALKLHYFGLPAGFTGGELQILANPCLELRVFFSKSSDVVLNWRDGIGGFFELLFLSGQHDYARSSAGQDQASFAPGASVNLTPALSDMRSRFGGQTTTFLYVFCPFLKADAASAEFRARLVLNKNPVELKDPALLEAAIVSDNEGSAGDSAPVKATFQSRIENIVAQVRGEGSPALVRKRMEEAPAKYYEVVRRDASVDLWGADSADVKKVG